MAMQASKQPQQQQQQHITSPFPDMYNAASRRGLFVRTIHGQPNKVASIARRTQINSQCRRTVEGTLLGTSQLIDIHPPPLSTKSLSSAIANFTLFIRPRHLLPLHN
jgi:hypothetical protein